MSKPQEHASHPGARAGGQRETPEIVKLRHMYPAWDRMSSAAHRLLLSRHAPLPAAKDVAKPRRSTRFTEALAASRRDDDDSHEHEHRKNVRVNSPAEDKGNKFSTTQSEPSIAVAGKHLVVGFNDSTPLASFSGYSTSDDGGRIFLDRGGIAGQENGDPVVAVDRHGHFYYACLSVNAAGQSNIAVSKSTDHGVTFGPAVDASTTANSPAAFQDKEWLTVDTTKGPHDGNLYLAWTRFAGVTSQIMFAVSTDGGASWSAPIALSAPGSYQGAMPVVGPKGDLYVVWFDDSGPQLLLMRSDDGGATFVNPVAGGGPLQMITPIPSTMNGNIRADSFPSIAVDHSTGRIYVAYPASSGADQADVYLTHSADKGKTWSAPLRVNDDATTNDQWMPSVAVNSKGTVAVMFYDRRHDPANVLIDVYCGLSKDHGKTILPNRRITTRSFPPAVNFDPRIAVNYMGDYNQVVAHGERFCMVWGDNRDKVGTRHDPNVYFASIEV